MDLNMPIIWVFVGVLCHIVEICENYAYRYTGHVGQSRYVLSIYSATLFRGMGGFIASFLRILLVSAYVDRLSQLGGVCSCRLYWGAWVFLPLFVDISACVCFP